MCGSPLLLRAMNACLQRTNRLCSLLWHAAGLALGAMHNKFVPNRLALRFGLLLWTASLGLAACATTPQEPSTAALAAHLIRTDTERQSTGVTGESENASALASQVPSSLESVEVIDAPGTNVLAETTDDFTAGASFDDLQATLDRQVQAEVQGRVDHGSHYVEPAIVNQTPASDLLTEPVIADGHFAVLAYHRVALDDSPYTVSPSLFARHMRFLHDQNFHTLSLDEMGLWMAGEIDIPPRSVLITIDDGHRSSFTEVHPVLLSYGFKAVYFPYSDYIDYGGLSSFMIRQMSRHGNAEFGLHTATHASLTELGLNESRQEYRARVVAELAEPTVLINSLAKPVRMSIAYPYGKVDRVVEAIATEQGIEFGFTVNCAMNTRNTNPMRLNRCTVGSADDTDLLNAKLTNPTMALRRIAQLNQPGLSLVKKGAPEFLGNLADREFFAGVPIEPFAPYFIDPDGDKLFYSAPGLPKGLSIDSHSGMVSGSPVVATRVSGLTITATDRNGVSATTNTFNVTVR